MTPGKRRKIILGTAAMVLGGVTIAAMFWDQAPRQGGRYDEIARLITKNLKFSRHFTWAVNTETIKAVRPHIGIGDVDVLARMLGDQQGKLGVAASSLLTLLGPDGEAALNRAAKSADIRMGMHARDGLMHIAQCRDPRVGNLDRAMCPGPTK
jgi:hypothetical protein